MSQGPNVGSSCCSPAPIRPISRTRTKRSLGSCARTVVRLKRSVVLPPESVPNLVRGHAMNARNSAPESSLASLPRPLTATYAIHSSSSVGEAERERFCSFCILPEMSLLRRVLEVDRHLRFVRPHTTRRKSEVRSACGMPHNHQEKRREHHPARHRCPYRATRVKAPTIARSRTNQSTPYRAGGPSGLGFSRGDS